MRTRFRFAAAVAALVAAVAVGCSDDVFEGVENVPLDQVPAPVMEAAKKALPGVTFTKAFKGKVEGGQVGYEIQGKARDGKVREAEVGLDGKLIGVE